MSEGNFEDAVVSVSSEKPQRNRILVCMLQNWFIITTIIGVLIGFGVGFAIQQAGINVAGKTWLGEHLTR